MQYAGAHLNDEMGKFQLAVKESVNRNSVAKTTDDGGRKRQFRKRMLLGRRLTVNGIHGCYWISVIWPFSMPDCFEMVRYLMV